MVGAAALGAAPQIRSQPPAVAGASTFERASLTSLSEPVIAVIAEKDGAAEQLRMKAEKAVKVRESDSLPAGSGDGRRIVFSETAQRVWLVGDDGRAVRTYLVSGSKFDNLDPGSYAVQSKSRYATAFDASGSMEYFVRFTTGFSAPIGFHTVPVDTAGRLEQTKEQLGTPTSAGCVRQWREDAVALWDFAPVGTTVVVTA